MKKIFFFSFFILVSSSLLAQSLKDVKKFLYTNKYKEAQTEVNNFLAVPANASNSEAWYYKGQIYNQLSVDSTLSFDQSLAMKNTAYDAFIKAQTLDPKDVMMKEDKYRPYLILYDGYYNLGVSQFNSKNFSGSYTGFKKAMELEDFIKAKGYTYDEIKFSPFDTSLTMNMAIAAYNAKDTASAMNVYMKFADANIGGETNQQIYEVLVDHYVRKGDKENAAKILAKARQLYPANDAWDGYEVKLAAGGDMAAKFAKYDEILKGNPTSFAMAYNYGADMYNSLYARGEERPKDPEATKIRLTEVLNQAIANDKGIDGLLLMTNHKYNIAADLSTDLSMAKDPKAKAELKKKTDAAFLEVVPYAEKVIAHYNKLPETTSGDRATKKNVLGYLMDVYDITGNKAKADEYQKLRTAVVI